MNDLQMLKDELLAFGLRIGVGGVLRDEGEWLAEDEPRAEGSAVEGAVTWLS